jgi:hypothetical protein
MRHLTWTLAVVACLAAPLPADSQNAVPRGGGGGGGSSSGGSSSGGSSSGGSSSGGSSWGGSSGGSSGGTYAAPRHPSGASSRARSGGSSGGTATPRRDPGGSSAGSAAGSDRVVGGRTRDGRPITGYAVPRGTVVPSGRPGGDYWYFPRSRDWFYSPWYYSRFSPWYYSGYGASLWGLGYIWDPFWFGPNYYDPWGVSGPGYGYAGGGYAGGGYDDDEDPVEGDGALRIKVKPREAKVMVDGTFAGVVDDFDGNFQKLRLEAGSHKIVLQADGYEPLAFDVLIVEGQTITYKGKLRER